MDVVLTKARHIPMNCTFRSANGRDGAACAEIVHEWGVETPWLGPLNDLEHMVEFWRGLLLEGDTAWVAEENGRVVGFCVRHDDNITGLYVAREARGRGVGKGLLDLAKAGRTWITVWAYEQNPRARKFYRREGLVEISREIEEGTNLIDIEHRWARSM